MSRSVAEMLEDWEPVIGLEVHVQLATRSKAFSPSAVLFGDPPNSLTDPLVMGMPGAMPADTEALIAYARKLELPLIGLMCIPPVEDDVAPHFAFLAKLAKENDLRELSMGMSGDFEMAIRFGATYVRVGSAIFGARAPHPSTSSG